MRTTSSMVSESTAAQHAALADHFDKASRIRLGAIRRPEPIGNRVVMPEIEPYVLVLVGTGSIPVATSGKVRRSACVERYRQDEFSRVDVTV